MYEITQSFYTEQIYRYISISNPLHKPVGVGSIYLYSKQAQPQRLDGACTWNGGFWHPCGENDRGSANLTQPLVKTEEAFIKQAILGLHEVVDLPVCIILRHYSLFLYPFIQLGDFLMVNNDFGLLPMQLQLNLGEKIVP